MGGSWLVALSVYEAQVLRFQQRCKGCASCFVLQQRGIDVLMIFTYMALWSNPYFMVCFVCILKIEALNFIYCEIWY